jgi:Tfp pilus assembly PilM family ATPase
MPKYLALEWDDHEIRLAIAHQRGSTAVLERAFAVPLPPQQSQPHTPAILSDVLKNALSGESLRRLETLAVVGRTSIELKELSLPPAPDDDLPDMVRFQALRDFTQISDETPLDFVPLPGEDAEHRSVLAAAISQELLNEINATCEQAGLELKHVVLRPSAAAALLSQHQPAAGQVRIFVDLLGDEVDLTVLDQDTPLLMRTTRLPGDAAQTDYCRPVFLEIRRTIAAVQNKLHGRRVEQVWLCGDGPSQQMLADMVKNEIELPTELFDPFTAFAQTADMTAKLPEHRSRYAPLLGMLADAAAARRHAIDFLEPRRRPPPKSRKREMSLAVALAAVVVLGFIGWTWWRANSLDQDIAQLRSRRSSLDKQIKKNSQVMKEAEQLDKWLAGDIPWLDVLQRLSTQGPKGEDAMLTGLRAEVDARGGGAKMTMDILASDSAKVQNQLRSVWAKTTRAGVEPSDGKIKRYPWQFKAEAKIDAPADEPATKPGVKPGIKPAVKSGVAKSTANTKQPPNDLKSEPAAPAKADQPAAKSDTAKTDTAKTDESKVVPAGDKSSATETDKGQPSKTSGKPAADPQTITATNSRRV